MTTSHAPQPITTVNQQGHTVTVLQARCDVCYDYILSLTSDPQSGWYHRESGLRKAYLLYAHDATPVK